MIQLRAIDISRLRVLAKSLPIKTDTLKISPSLGRGADQGIGPDERYYISDAIQDVFKEELGTSRTVAGDVRPAGPSGI